MYERLTQIVPTLQTMHCFRDLIKEEDYTLPEHETTRREGYLHIERWQKEGVAEEEAVWLFMAVEPGCRVPEEVIEERVWSRVEAIEAPGGERFPRGD